MELTFIGMAQILIGGMIVLAGRLRHALLLLMVSALFGGSASLVLPALGGSSVPPVQFALLFVYLRLLLPGGGTLGQVPDAFRANRWFAMFVVYGAVSAFVLPRMFAGQFRVAPMRALETADLFATVPLEPTSQNITAALYLVGALLTVMAVWIAARRPGMAATLVAALVGMAWFHVLTGASAAALNSTPAAAIFEAFRNGNYAQLDDAVGGMARIRGLFPEASAYAGFGFALFVANAELWYRSIRSRATGWAALATGLVLFFSTSSTAYIGLAAYAALFTVRVLLLPGIANPAKVRSALVAVGFAAFLAAIGFVLMPDLLHSLIDVVKRMTLEKSDSDSSLQRLFWTMQGWEMFTASWGLGVGAGSFRSSSLLFAILGSMGVIGIASFAIYLATVFKPALRSSWASASDRADTIGGALGSAALLSLVPAMVNGASPIPGAGFLILAGAAVALRPSVRPVHRRRDRGAAGPGADHPAAEVMAELHRGRLVR